MRSVRSITVRERLRLSTEQVNGRQKPWPSWWRSHNPGTTTLSAPVNRQKSSRLTVRDGDVVISYETFASMSIQTCGSQTRLDHSAVHQHPMFGGVEIAAAAMAPYLPRSTKLAASHAALVLVTPADSRDQGIFRNDQRGSKGGSTGRRAYVIVSPGAVSSYESAGNTGLTMSQQKPSGLLSLGRWTAKA